MTKETEVFSRLVDEFQVMDSSELGAFIGSTYYFLTKTPKFSQLVGNKALQHIPEFNYPFDLREVRIAKKIFYNLFYGTIGDYFCVMQSWYDVFEKKPDGKYGSAFLISIIEFFENVDESVISELTDKLGEIYADVLLTSHKFEYRKISNDDGYIAARTYYPDHYATIVEQLKPLEFLIRLSV